MGFSYAAGVITQTGTDTDLSGLSGLTGVTTFISDPDVQPWGQKIYEIDAATRLVIDGTLTIEPDSEMLIISGAPLASTEPPLRLNGTLNLGVQKTGNGNTIYSDAVGINLTDKGTNNFSYWGIK